MSETVADSGKDEHIVVAGVLCRAGRALLVHRSPSRRWYPDVWDLPGGHVEPGEAPQRALEQELAEELGITAIVTGEPFARLRGDDFVMDVWVLDQWRGEAANQDVEEHDALAWLTSDEMSALRLADARRPRLVRAALQQPRSTQGRPSRLSPGPQ
ncbi:NUDIX domain-containing protein [Aquipuribacter nitratireducens]|uniref:8-oxo-dGTP diphosphatase n=1 Tax=Aquipuribacter nitratireducens TaxID=650104 RepID=A0ABW0GQ25_9MICO